MLTRFLSSPEARLALALGIGLLVGIERERRRAAQTSGGFAGLRTFGLVGLLGGVFGYLDIPLLEVAGALVVGLSAIAAYVVNRSDADRGMTTELALVVTYGLGILALRAPAVAAGAAVAAAAMLAMRGSMHAFVRDTLTEQELRDGLVFLLFFLVVLPWAPDRAFGPYGAINPQSLTRVVVTLMFLNGLAHLAQRLVGPRYGLSMMGFLAGFISSSATIAALGVRAREQPTLWRSAVAGALASSVATLLQYAFMIAIVDVDLLWTLLPSLAFALLVALSLAVGFAVRAGEAASYSGQQGSPFRLIVALGFAAVFALVSVASSALHARFGRGGIVMVSVFAGFVDAHSTAASVASLYRGHGIDATTAQFAILSALSANTFTKIAVCFVGRHLKFGLYVSAGVLLIAAAAWAGLLARREPVRSSSQVPYGVSWRSTEAEAVASPRCAPLPRDRTFRCDTEPDRA